MQQQTVSLSDLIDTHFSDSFTIELNFDGVLHEGETYVFDEEDRRNWGGQPMVWEPNARAYVSEWQDDLFRLVCRGN